MRSRDPDEEAGFTDRHLADSPEAFEIGEVEFLDGLLRDFQEIGSKGLAVGQEVHRADLFSPFFIADNAKIFEDGAGLFRLQGEGYFVPRDGALDYEDTSHRRK